MSLRPRSPEEERFYSRRDPLQELLQSTFNSNTTDPKKRRRKKLQADSITAVTRALLGY